ncbi:hypothetical protein ACTG16_21705 [Aeromonas sp. 23P]|uniref:hypothetical protein n=1 Tax=Aeromonas sp. 23P TaxID=3452716 RepID=UPI003F7B0063
MSNSRFLKPQYLNIMSDSQKMDEIIKSAGEIQKVVETEFKPFSSKVGEFFRALSQNTNLSRGLGAVGSFGSLLATGLHVYGSIAASKGGQAIMSISAGELEKSIIGGAALLVSAYALPPLAKGLGTVVERFGLHSYLNSNKGIEDKMLQAVEKLDPKLSPQELEMTIWSARAQILRKLHVTEIAKSPSVKAAIVEELESRIHKGYGAVMEKKLGRSNIMNNDYSSPSM